MQSAKGERVTQPLLTETPSTVSHSSTGSSRGDQSNATGEQSQPKASTKEKFFRSVLEGNSNEVSLLLKSDSALASEVDDQQMSGLHYAARKGDAVMVKVLIDAGANVNLTDREGALPLHIACRYNHEAVIKRLLSTEKKLENKLVSLQMEYKQDEVEKNVTNSIERQDKRGVTPFMLMASACGHQFLKNCLDDLQNVDTKNLLRTQDSDGNTAMHYAARNNRPLNITTLHNIKADTCINATNLEQETPMHVAATLGLEESVRKLLELKADPNLKDKLGRTPLHRGIICKQENICSALINWPTTEIVVPDADLMTPFHWACRRGQLSVVKRLIQRHPNALNALDIKKRNGLHWAVLTGSLPLVNFLLGNAAKRPGKSRVIDAKDMDLKCPIHYAVKMGDSKLLRAFLNHGASFDVIDSEGRTPTQLAVKLGHIDMVRNICIHSQTLKQQALKHRDMSGRTSLLIAAKKGHTNLFNYLLEQGSDFTAKDEIGRTALMLNVGSGCNAIAKILIDRGVDINAIDTGHNTALHYACKRVEAKAKCVALLLKNGAKLLQNCNGNTPVDLAVINRNEAAINVFFSDDFRKSVMDYRKDNGATHMDTLIEHSPKTAMLILDQSMTPSSTADPTAKDFMVKFDFVHLDPESNHRKLAHERYLALKTMVKHSRMDLLQHPLCQALLKRKWTRFRYFLWIDLAAYVTFLVFLAVSVRLLGPILVSESPQINSTTLCWNYTFNITSQSGKLTAPFLPLKWAVAIFMALCVILLVVKRSVKGFNLLLSDRENVAFMFIFTFSIVFIYPLFREPPCFNNGIFGMISVIMGCFMIIFKAQILPGVGIYAQMFQGVFVSMVKLLLIFSCVIFGFALAFHIGFIYHEPFANFPYAFTKTLDMAGGDLEFATYFIKGAKGSMQNGLVVVFNLFVIIIPICLINLLIAVAVGDIKGITKEASLRCIKIQIKLVDAFQNMRWRFLLFPRQDRFLEVYPNRTIRNKVSKWLLPDDEATMYNDWLKRCADRQAETSNEKRLVDIESSIQLLSSRLEEIKRLQLEAKEIKLNVLPSSRSASCTRPK